MEKFLVVWPKSDGVVHINYHYTDFGEIVDYLQGVFSDKIVAFDCDIQQEDILDIINQNNVTKVAMMVNYENVKNICTALEFEFSKSKIKKEKEAIIVNLIKKVKKVVKEYKTENPDLTDKAYQSITGSLSKWTFPATEQFYSLYEASKTVVDKILVQKNLEITEPLIQSLVKCRNEITHGNKPKLTTEIANTSYSMIILIYVSLFKRIGLTDDEIFQSFEMIF